MKSVALLIETSRTYGRELLRGVRQHVGEGECWSMTVELRDLQSPTPAWLNGWQGDGILARTSSRAMATAIRSCDVPVVELRSTRWNPRSPFFGIDNDAVGRMVADHLMDSGLRHYAVYELDTEPFFAERAEAFAEHLRQQGFGCHRHLQTGGREKPVQWERQQVRLVKWLNQLPRPVGILACTDQLGCWLLDACRRAGLSVPDDVAVVGVENDATLCELSDPPLSSVALGGQRVGRAAAAELQRLMNGGRVRKRPTLLAPAGLIPRQSSDLVAVEDPIVAAAIRQIRGEAAGGLTVDQLATDLDISRSNLERRFRETIGRSPNQQIVRVRLDLARAALRNGTQSLDTIAKSTGLTTAAYLSHRFREVFGETPGEYRKRHG